MVRRQHRKDSIQLSFDPSSQSPFRLELRIKKKVREIKSNPTEEKCRRRGTNSRDRGSLRDWWKNGPKKKSSLRTVP